MNHTNALSVGWGYTFRYGFGYTLRRRSDVLDALGLALSIFLLYGILAVAAAGATAFVSVAWCVCQLHQLCELVKVVCGERIKRAGVGA